VSGVRPRQGCAEATNLSGTTFEPSVRIGALAHGRGDPRAGAEAPIDAIVRYLELLQQRRG